MPSTIGSVSRPKDASGFVVLPRRRVVERSLAWMMHARRHARDYERLVQHSETLITWAAITLMTRRLARKGATRAGQGSRHWPADAARRLISQAAASRPPLRAMLKTCGSVLGRHAEGVPSR